jgi:murein DD-endopeptidase MepM/ murein hydrolase activator NlpD
MVDFHNIPEPEVDPLADTNPSMSIRPVDLQMHQPKNGWQRTAGLLSLLGAVVLTAAAVVILVLPKDSSETAAILPTQPPVSDTIQPTDIPATAVPDTVQAVPLRPTASSDLVLAVLNAPIQRVSFTEPVPVVSAALSPFTIIPDRPRSEVIDYIVVKGDTIYTIAERFNLQPETIAWANSRNIIRVLIPGDVITIPPTDGVYIATIGSKTIAEIAAQYKVDPYAIIDYESNGLFGASPDLIPESGTHLMIPGGEAEPITWNPGIVEETGTTASGGNAQYVTFAPGDAGSCGRVENTGGTYWTNPLPNGTWVRGFTSWHTGVDLAATTGTPVYAANGGRVVFAGWNSWGYGNTVVLAHGPFMTLYGHLSSIAVSCNAWADAGTVIGGVGSTGNSSGPHLHFEIRYNNTPTDPAATIGF